MQRICSMLIMLLAYVIIVILYALTKSSIVLVVVLGLFQYEVLILYYEIWFNHKGR